MIEISNLTKRYGKKTAVDNISFNVQDGEVVGFLGPNGAGKSTTMSIITGYLSYTEGSVKVDGLEVIDDPLSVKKKIGYLPEQPPLYSDMTVYEYLDFVFELKKAEQNKTEHISEIISAVGIGDVRKRLIRNLSKGYKQRVGLAQALIGDPPILILDEPTVGLDPKQIIGIRNVIKELGKTKTVILSSHILSEVSAVCERVVIINKGHIIAEDTPDNLAKQGSNKQELTIRISGDKEKIISAFKSLDSIASFLELPQKEENAFDFLVTAIPGADIRKPLFNLFASRSLPILMLVTNTLSLEDVFIQLTKDNDKEAGLNSGKRTNSKTVVKQ